MSVIIPDLKIYNYIYNGLHSASYNRICDEFYSKTILNHFNLVWDNEKEARRLIVSWLQLNQRSFAARYNQPEVDFVPFLNYEIIQLEPFQLLKYVRCVSYNIEIETIQKIGEPGENPNAVTKQQLDDYSLLKRWENDIVRSIIDVIPTYRNAKWSDAV